MEGKDYIKKLVDRVIDNNGLKREDLYPAENISNEYLWDFILSAGKIMRHFCGEQIFMCSIANVKSGNCPEDCSFCAQSSASKTDIPRYNLIGETERIVERAYTAKSKGSKEFCLVAAWKGLKKNSAYIDRICNAVEKIKKEVGIEVALSMGHIDKYAANELISAGAVRYNHNLETSEKFFPNICSTHSWRDNYNTIEILKEAGFEVCSGGIMGMGESWKDRVDLAFSLKELDVEHIPVNILIPIPGTPLENIKPLHPLESLKTIAMFRFVNPKKVIIVAGGREKNLRDLQSCIFLAGANGIIGGDYLTTKGRSIEDDVQMIKDIGLKLMGNTL